MKFSELQQQLKEKFGIDHLADIARELGVSPQAVSNWKARDRIPYKYVLKIRQQHEVSVTQGSGQSENNISNSNQVSPLNEYPQNFEETISLMEILLTLVKHLRIIIVTPTIFCIYMIIHVQFFVQPVYVSTAKIMSSDGGGDGSQVSGLAAQLGFNLSSNPSSQWVFPEIVKSRTLARAMIKRRFDTEKYGPQKTLLQILTYGDEEPTIGIDTLIKAGVDGFIGMVKIQLNGSFYDLSIRAPEPVFARDVAIVLLEELDAHQSNYNSAKISKTRKFIEERIVDAEKELNKAEEALKDFRIRNRRIENSPSLQLEQERLSREVAVIIGVFTTLKQQLETTKIDEVKKSGYVIVLDPPEAPLDNSNPSKKRMVIIAGFLGIGFGIGLAFLKEYFDNNNDEIKEIIHNIFSDILESRMLRIFR